MFDQPDNIPSAIKNFFIHPVEGRLRMFWRLLVFGIVLIASTICVSAVLVPLMMAAGESIDLTNPSLGLSSLVSLFSITGSVFLVRWFVDRKSIKSLGLRLNQRMLLDLLVGFIIPFGQFLVIFGISVLLGWTRSTGFAWQSNPVSSVIGSVLIGLLTFLAVGWTEELMFRGYLLQNLEEGTNLFWALVISSAFFSVGHFLNPNRTWTALVGLLLAGLFLAFAYLRTRQLWLAIGLHIGWNFFEGTIFGYPVSGLQQAGLIQHETSGPTLITGGQFGPEAGLILIPGILMGAFFVWLYTKDRDTSLTPANTPLHHKE